MDNTKIKNIETRLSNIENFISQLKSSNLPIEFINSLVLAGFLKYESDIYYEAGVGGNAFHDIFIKYKNEMFNLNVPNKLRAFTVNIATDVCTSQAHGLNNGDTVNFYTTNTLPSGLDSLIVTYSIINSTDNTFKVSTDGVNPVDITSLGSGVQYVQPY